MKKARENDCRGLVGWKGGREGGLSSIINHHLLQGGRGGLRAEA